MKAAFEHHMDLLQTEELPDGSIKLLKHEHLQVNTTSSTPI